jgi:hypothetical protein
MRRRITARTRSSTSVSLYRTLGRHGRNGIWVYWRSLDTDNVRELRRAMNDCWHRAKRPDPEEKRSTNELSEEEVEMIMRSTPSDSGETDA